MSFIRTKEKERKSKCYPYKALRGFFFFRKVQLYKVADKCCLAFVGKEIEKATTEGTETTEKNLRMTRK